MSLTRARLRAWNTAALEDSAAQVESVRRRLDATTGDLGSAVRMLENGWHGDAAVLAIGAIRTQARVGSDLGEALLMTRRTLLAAADALTAAKALLAQAEALAEHHGLVLTATSVEPVGAGETAEQWEVRREVRAMLRTALRAAQEADRDAARAVRAALEAADLTPGEERDRVDEIGVHALPVGRSPAAVAMWWRSLSPAAQALLARRDPLLIGNLDGVPYEVRMAANQLNIGHTLRAADAESTALEAQIADLNTRWQSQGLASHGYPDVGLLSELTGLEERLADARNLREMCDRLLTEPTNSLDGAGNLVPIEGHQVVVFDPDRGRFAEIVGSIGPDTRNIAVMVGGTGTNLFTMDGQYERAWDFVGDPRNVDGGLAVLSYLGGPMPQQVAFDAFDTSYATAQGDELARFANGIDKPAGAAVTVLAHSYGGSVVGAAEAAGMHVDRVLHVESAGSGPGVVSIEDYAYPDTDRYTMTAPGDPILYAQGTSVGPVGHGSSPGNLDGVVELETGRVDHDDPRTALLRGGPAHSGVFVPGSTAWENMYSVMTGGDAMLYTEPTWAEPDPTSVHVEEFRYPMEDPSYKPPTYDVR